MADKSAHHISAEASYRSTKAHGKSATMRTRESAAGTQRVLSARDRPFLIFARARVYLYELRRGDQIIATGHLNHDQPLEVGERIGLAGHTGILREIIPGVGHNPVRLIVELLPDPSGT